MQAISNKKKHNAELKKNRQKCSHNEKQTKSPKIRNSFGVKGKLFLLFAVAAIAKQTNAQMEDK